MASRQPHPRPLAPREPPTGSLRPPAPQEPPIGSLRPPVPRKPPARPLCPPATQAMLRPSVAGLHRSKTQ
jgi:hypothetical protein